MLSLVQTLQSFSPPLCSVPPPKPTHKAHILLSHRNITSSIRGTHASHKLIRSPSLLIPRAAADHVPSPDRLSDAPPTPSLQEPESKQEDATQTSAEQGESNEANEEGGDGLDDEEQEEAEEGEENKGTIVTNDPAAAAAAASEEEGKAGMLRLAVVFGLWYVQNVVFNIYNKKVLNLFPYPWLLSTFQLLVGSLWMAALWAAGLQPRPRFTRRFLAALAAPALFHAVGHISACVSFSHSAVSFTHVIKSSEPAFSVALSALHGTFYPIHVWLALVPIVAGCSLAAVTEASFSAAGLSGALISNVGFVLRNIYSKQSLYHFRHVDGLNLYGCISVVSLLYLFPVAVLVEGRKWSEGLRVAVAMAAGTSATAPWWTFYGWVVVSGVFYHLYNQSSYQALDRISPLTFSVGNTMKRVVVIVASVLVFRNPIRPLNALGSAIAVFGTFLYSQATAAKKNKKLS